jgi:lipopolysaccharide transport system permease protein
LLVIKPTSGWVAVRLKDVWVYRELLYFLTWRDIKVRYKQTGLGITWVILQPFLIMLVLSAFFGRLLQVPTAGLPYPVFFFAALLPWQLFSQVLSETGNSLVTQERLVTKVYFPRLIIPLSKVLVALVDFSLGLLVLLGMMLYYEIHPARLVWALPVFILMAAITALAVGLWLAALNVQYRDVRYTIPFLTQLWLFVSPVAYPSGLVPEAWRFLYGLNPMAGVIEGFRWALGDKTHGPGLELGISLAAATLLLGGGLYYFRRMEKNFADVI